MTIPETLQPILNGASLPEASDLLAVFEALAPEDRQKLLHYAQQLAAHQHASESAPDAHDVLSDADEEEVRRILSLFGQR